MATAKLKDKTIRYFADKISDELNLRLYTTDNTLKIKLCENEKEYIAFVFNYTDEDIKGHISCSFIDEDVFVRGK
ncbi:MAG: hypothetical protein IJ460_00325 [Clostridia bacterium]|nr:hypothetical protein [Clostridia bacterium]